MSRANLSCPRCGGEYGYVGGTDNSNLFECSECGDALEQRAAEELAEEDGPAAEIAKLLLQGGTE